MKILAVNKFHYRRAGAERAYFDTAEMLRRHGHQVVFWSMRHPENEPDPGSDDFLPRVEFEGRTTPAGALRKAGRLLYSSAARRRLARVLDREKPDLAHLHNIYHHLTPSILGVLRRRGIPTVLTLHDYKVVCPSYTLFSAGRPCERCRGGRYRAAVRRRCGKGSLTGGALLAAEAYLHGRLLRSYRNVDLFLSPSRFLADKVREMGFSGPLVRLSNPFLAGPSAPDRPPAGRRILFAGRLTPEKGVETLLEAARGLDADVLIAGQGPGRPDLESRAAGAGLGRVVFLGRLDAGRVAEEIRRSAVVVCPSRWYENQPYTVLEAFAARRPVVASRIGGLPELVRDGRTGLLFEPGDVDGLRRALASLLDDPGWAAQMGRRARAFIETEFDPQAAYAGLMEAYARAAASRRARP